jgi:tight adherence protein C
MTGLLLGAAFFLFVMGAVTAVGYFFLRTRPVTEAADAPLVLGRTSDWQDAAADALSVVGAWSVRPGKRADNLRKQLFRAGYRMPSALQIFYGVQIAAGLFFALVVGWAVSFYKGALGEGLLPALCAVGFGYYIPARVLEYQTRARSNRIRIAVPPALDLLVLALEAGQSLDQALLDTASSLRSVYPDLSSELMFTNLEMNAGTGKQEALRHLAERSGEDELRKLANLLIDAERFGTTLGPALRTHSRYLRTRMRQLAQEAARKLTVKLVIPVFFLIFPSVLLVTLGPAYLQMRQFLDSFLK